MKITAPNGHYLLPIREAFCSGQIVCRFLRPINMGECVILAIPGGPGLSSIYLDPFMRDLAGKTNTNVATMDLPNHGESIITDTENPLSYTECLEFVRRAVVEISEKAGSLVLFGQSFGARLAFDLLAKLEHSPTAVLLTGFPYVFEISSALANKLNDLPLDPAQTPKADEDNWRKILPLNTAKPLPEEVFDALATRSYLPDGHQMLVGTPPIQDVAPEVRVYSPILVVESGLDPVVPDGNWEVLRSVMPQANFVSMDTVGHFPMVEAPEQILSIFCRFIEQARKSEQ